MSEHERGKAAMRDALDALGIELTWGDIGAAADAYLRERTDLVEKEAVEKLRTRLEITADWVSNAANMMDLRDVKPELREAVALARRDLAEFGGSRVS
jgi:hypothetical protein